MALTKTVNYTQEVPQSLGFTNEITGTTGTVTATLQYNNKMGTLKSSVNKELTKIYGCDAIGGDWTGGTWEIIGTEAEVNAALNALTWIPKTYADAALEQDAHSEHREVTDHEGECLFQIEDRFGLFGASGIAIGDPFYVRTVGVDNEFLDKTAQYICTKIETTLSQTRVYGVYALPYELEKAIGNKRVQNRHKLVKPYVSELIGPDGTTVIDFIIDYAIINPHGDSDISIDIFDDAVLHDSGIVSLVGSLFVPEPYWVTDPVAIVDGSPGSCSVEFNMGTVAQANDDLLAVQLLFKRHQNDPNFDGVVQDSNNPPLVGNKPSYIMDNSYGIISTARVGNRTSENFVPTEDIPAVGKTAAGITYDLEAGEWYKKPEIPGKDAIPGKGSIVRWEFYGTPAECNRALSKLRVYSFNDSDFFIEARIVTGRSRIYRDRGYD